MSKPEELAQPNWNDLGPRMLEALKRMVQDCPPSNAIPTIWNNLAALEQARAIIKEAGEME